MNQEEIVFQGKLIEVVHYDVEVAPGIVKTFEKARRAPGTRLIIPTEKGLLLTKEHRHELGGFDYRLPGGKVFDALEEYNEFLEKGNDILEPARAKAIDEAKEEVGIVVKELKHFHSSVCGATVDWDLYYFVITDYERAEQALEPGENIEVIEVSREEARAMCMDGRISEERSAMVLLRYLTKQKEA